MRALLGSLLLLVAAPVGAADHPEASNPAATQPAQEAHVDARNQAIFAGGCFWCEETAFEGQPGVLSVVSGYAGGTQKSPTYEQVGAGNTGHAESVKVTFDPSKTSYAKLLDTYWHNVDPFSAEGQFCDRGHQYRGALFVLDDAQKQAAEASKRAWEQKFGRPIVVEVTQVSEFWPAEEYHQDFYKKDPRRYHSYRTACGRDARLKNIWGVAPVTAQ